MMSRVNQSRRATAAQRPSERKMSRGDFFPRSSLSLRGSVAITLVLFAVACRQDMQDQPKYKPLAPSRFFSDGKSARQLVEGTVPYSPEGTAISPSPDESKATTLPFALTPQVM